MRKTLSLGVLIIAVLAMAAFLWGQNLQITQGPKVENVTDQKAVIAWSTNTNGSTVVRYGTDQNNLGQRAQAPYADAENTQQQVHRVRLNHLQPGTTYFFQAVSGHGEGTGTEDKSQIAQFTTKGAGNNTAGTGQPAETHDALRITDGPRVEGTGANWAVIAWTTNTGGSSVVLYGTDPNNLTQRGQAPYADDEKSQHQVHRVRLNNLQPHTRYFFIVDSGQGEGTGTEAKSGVTEFTTQNR